MPRVQPHRDHVPLHRLWAFTTFEEGLSLSEHAHVVGCTECTTAFRTCFGAETFGAALKELYPEGEIDADARPKLRFLYVITGERPLS